MSTEYSITSAGIDPATDRAQRTRTYLISMAVRFVCVLFLFVVPGWWALLPALGAIFLPYIAVMMANNVSPTIDDYQAVTPSAMALSAPDPQSENSGSKLLIIDALAERSSVGERIYETAQEASDADA